MHEPENTHTLTITVAGFTVSVRTQDEATARQLRQRYADFLDDSPSLLTIDLKVVPGAIFIDPEPGPWIIESSYEETHLTYRSYLEQGEVNWETGRGHLEMHPNAEIENFLRVIYAWLCLKNGGVLLHSAGIIRDGDGYVFFGPSGAGKSTTSRLSASVGTVLSDDLVIILPDNGGQRLYGVPFRGQYSQAPRANQNAPLKAIFRLQQDTHHALEPLSHTKAVAELVAASPFVVRDLNLSDQLLFVCDQIARSTPIRELHFKKDNGFWKIIDGYNRTLSQTASTNGR